MSNEAQERLQQQIEYQKEIQLKSNLNIVYCGYCRAHQIQPRHKDNYTCYNCNEYLDASDFVDLFFESMSLTKQGIDNE